jgi:hypothetical protein
MNPNEDLGTKYGDRTNFSFAKKGVVILGKDLAEPYASMIIS